VSLPFVLKDKILYKWKGLRLMPWWSIVRFPFKSQLISIHFNPNKTLLYFFILLLFFSSLFILTKVKFWCGLVGGFCCWIMLKLNEIKGKPTKHFYFLLFGQIKKINEFNRILNAYNNWWYKLCGWWNIIKCGLFLYIKQGVVCNIWQLPTFHLWLVQNKRGMLNRIKRRR